MADSPHPDPESAPEPGDGKKRPWTGAEPTQGAGTPTPAPGAPWRGDERTIGDAPTSRPDEADWLGDDRTIPDQGKPAEPGSDDDWVGDDRTIPDQGKPGGDGADDWVGDDRTMPDGALQAKTDRDADWVGDDRTVPDQGGGVDSEKDWSGHDQTLIGAGAEAKPGTARIPRDGSGTQQRSGVGSSVHRSRATSVTFDEAWHMDGRKGPFTGQVWGDWEIGGMLGEGGMGAVYRGKQTSLKRRVAIKVLAPNLAQDPRLLQRFQLEARMTSMLSSPNLVQVFAAGEWEGNHFFVMEYVEGTDLYDVIRRRRDENRPFTPDEAADIVIQAAKGLAEAGRYGMVHRDIKPSNLMVTTAGLVKIADFGIVKVLGESSLTLTGQAVGTPSYVSPEQGRGLDDIDQRSDLYSLGVVFYELLCDKKPFEATTPNALIYKHCYSEPVLPRELNAAISDEYQAVVLKCLQKKPENRYQSAAELITDLEAIYTGNALRVALASGKIGTGAAEAQRENMSWVQRNLLGLVAGLVAIALAGGAGGLYYYSSDQDRRAKAANERLRAGELYQALSVLNDPRPVPAGARDLLDEYAGLSGADTDRVAVWRAKLLRIADLRERLERLDDAVVTAEVRADGRTALAAYREEVGLDDPAAAAWDARLQELARRETALRDQVGALDLLPTLNQSQRDSAQPLVDELMALAGAEDAQAQRAAARLADFDRRRDGYLSGLAILDDEATTITEAQARELQISLDALQGMIGGEDPRLQRWALAITAKGRRVAELRARLARLDEHDLPPLALQLELQRDLTTLQELIPATDPQLRDWKARIAAATGEIASLRERLAIIDQQEHLPVVLWAETDRLLQALVTLVGELDGDVIRWHQRRDADRAWVDGHRATIGRSGDPAPLTFLERRDLVVARDALLGVGALDQRSADALAARLAAEDRAIAALRTRLAILDRVEPVTPATRADLADLGRRCPPDDADLARWTGRVAGIDALLVRLAILDHPEAIPASAGEDLDRLEALVGPGEEHVLRWRGKLATVAALRGRLATLDRIEPPAPGTAADLQHLVTLVGQDAQVLRWQERFARISEVADRLGLLLHTTQQDQAAVDAARADLADLAGLIGGEAPAVIRLGQRQDHLDGPPRPAWAADFGRDRIGLFADVDLPGGRQRLRFLPGGSFRMGSPTAEAHRDSDELQVEVHLTAACWIADSECSQAQWRALMGSSPSRDQGDDRPVERVTWDEAKAYCQALGDSVGKGFAPRLPSEAEWEYAARAGDAAWVPEPGDRSGFDAVAWHAGNAAGSTKEVRRRFQNPLGCYDLLGNVAEWCEDRYGSYPTGVVEDPLGAGGELRVARGGSWGDRPAQLRLANRIAVAPQTRSAYLGFRIAAPVDGDGLRWFPSAEDRKLLPRKPNASADVVTPADAAVVPAPAEIAEPATAPAATASPEPQPPRPPVSDRWASRPAATETPLEPVSDRWAKPATTTPPPAATAGQDGADDAPTDGVQP